MSQSANLWTVPIGDDDAFAVTIYGDNNKPIEFTGSEPLTMQCWQGDDLAQVPSLVIPTWTGGDPRSGTCIVTVSGSASLGMTPDFFILRLNVEYNGGKFCGWEGWLRLGDAPGIAVAPNIYCSLQDIIDVGGEWVTRLMVETGRTSFLPDRARARRELDKIIVNRFRPAAMTDMAYLASGYSSGQLISELPDQYVVGLLAANKLIVNEDVKEACAYYALSIICERSISWDKEDTFHARASFYKAKFNRSVNSIVAQFDTNGDGKPDLASNLGVFSFR